MTFSLRTILRPLPALLAGAIALAGCTTGMPMPAPSGRPADSRLIQPDRSPALPPEMAARNFVGVVQRMEPLIESECRSRTRGQANCDYQIMVDDRPAQGPNAFQTLDRSGRPIIAFNLPLIAEARNPDELAFVLGHEAAHHIAGHIPRQQQSAMTGAIILGGLAAATGYDAATVREAQNIGASVGARTYAKDFELEADRLGTVITWHAGYDPELGSAFFSRLPDPGDRFLGTHPPNGARLALVRRTVEDLRSGRLH